MRSLLRLLLPLLLVAVSSMVLLGLRLWKEGEVHAEVSLTSRTCRTPRLSVVALCFRPSRLIPLLKHFDSIELVSDVLVVWNNLDEDPPAFTVQEQQLPHDVKGAADDEQQQPVFRVPVRVVREQRNTLNNRYRHADLLHSSIALLTVCTRRAASSSSSISSRAM